MLETLLIVLGVGLVFCFLGFCIAVCVVIWRMIFLLIAAALRSIVGRENEQRGDADAMIVDGAK
jgi:hypothetical protein